MSVAIDLDGRVALVTGSARGIGRACALLLAEAGANVVVNYRSNREAGEAVVDRMRQMGRHPLLVQADAGKTDETDAMVRQAIHEYGKIDILVSNAGAGTPFAVADTTDDEYYRVFDINVKGFLSTARAIVPGMKERRWGKIVAISSITGKTGKAFLSPSPTYAAAKAAIVGMTRGLARECAPFGVNVNCVRPGWTDTEGTSRASPEVKANAIKEMPLGRTGLPEDIAGAVLFLVSDYSAYMTGMALDVNGGLFIG